VEPHDPQASRWPVSLVALKTAIGRTNLALLCWLVPFFAALVLAIPWGRWVAGATPHRYARGELMAGLDENFRTDHRAALAALREAGAQGGAVLAFALMLFGCFAAGGWLQVFLERTQGHSVRRFLWGGSRFFWRFLRLWILTLLQLSLVTWLCFGWPWKRLVLAGWLGLAGGELEELASERDAVLVQWMQAGLHATLVALVLAWGDYARTRIALHEGRSALWAGATTWGLFLRHPLHTLRPFAGLLALEMAMLVALGELSWSTNLAIDTESSIRSIVALSAISQLALLGQCVVRAARYHAAIQVSRRLVPPPPRRDRWSNRVGGPGGPQYPIGDQDEYGVSI
jgi:hypothetical protein